MTREQALPYVGHYLDDGLSPDHSAADLRDDARLVGWRCGFEPMFVAVQSYIPGVRLDDDEAAEIASDYLAEIGWFSDGPDRPRLHPIISYPVFNGTLSWHFLPTVSRKPKRPCIKSKGNDPMTNNNRRSQTFVVSLYAKGERRASDCYPDFLPTRSDAIAAGEESLKMYEWATRYTIRRIWLT